MNSNIIDGRKIAADLLAGLKQEVLGLKFQPIFYDVLVGEDPVSLSYVKIKGKKAESIGIDFRMLSLPKDISTQELVEKIQATQAQPNVCGLIVQLPLPGAVNKQEILQAIDKAVDVDGLNGGFSSPTVAAVLEIFERYQIDLSGLNVLIVGQGDLVGKPLSAILRTKAKHLDTVDLATSSNLEELAGSADVIISAAGVPKLINGQIIKEGTIIIDCGTSESGGSIVGDVDTDSVAAKAKIISPVPGGVGPVTVAELLKNVVAAAKLKP